MVTIDYEALICQRINEYEETHHITLAFALSEILLTAGYSQEEIKRIRAATFQVVFIDKDRKEHTSKIYKKYTDALERAINLMRDADLYDNIYIEVLM